jgi:hypothetical protein
MYFVVLSVLWPKAESGTGCRGKEYSEKIQGLNSAPIIYSGVQFTEEKIGWSCGTYVAENECVWCKGGGGVWLRKLNERIILKS